MADSPIPATNPTPQVPDHVRKAIQKALDEREYDNQFNVSPIPSHAHTGADSAQINPINLLGWPTISVVPTDMPQNGTFRFFYNPTSGIYGIYAFLNAQWVFFQQPTPPNFFGDGSDGSVVFDGSTTVLGIVPSASTYTLTRDIFTSSMTVNAGVTVITNGWRIFCTGTLTVASTAIIEWNGTTGGAGVTCINNTTFGTGGTAGAAPIGNTVPGGTAGAAGGNGAGVKANNAGGDPGIAGSLGTSASHVLGVGAKAGTVGGAGGNGNIGSPGGAGGTGGFPGGLNSIAINLPRTPTAAYMLTDPGGSSLSPAPGAGGSGGGGGGGGTSIFNNYGGGGGGGGGSGSTGGFVVIFASSILNSGIIESLGGVGGAGGNGGNCGSAGANPAGGGGGGAAGSGGNGGIVILVYHTLTGTGTLSVAGGAVNAPGIAGLGNGIGSALPGSNGSGGINGAAGLIFQVAV